MSKVFTIQLVAGSAAVLAVSRQQAPQSSEWTSEFRLEAGELATAGRNPYLDLRPGRVLVLEDGDQQLKVTVLPATELIGTVETRVVEERETKAGQLVEVSRNYLAISRRTNAVFYFGEDVDIYRGGKVVNHEGAWRAGRDGARFGLFLPGLPLLHSRYYQEVAPRVALDRAEIVDLGVTLSTPAGEFRNVMKVAETTPLEPGVREFKYYGWGVGLLQDGSLKLTQRDSAGPR